jgi:hypothetical protein
MLWSAPSEGFPYSAGGLPVGLRGFAGQHHRQPDPASLPGSHRAPVRQGQAYLAHGQGHSDRGGARRDKAQRSTHGLPGRHAQGRTEAGGQLGHASLAAGTRRHGGCQPRSVFTNSRRNRIKILFWDNTGWWVCAKRLETGTLAWPASPSPSIELSSEELTLLLSGIDLSKTHRKRSVNPMVPNPN